MLLSLWGHPPSIRTLTAVTWSDQIDLRSFKPYNDVATRRGAVTCLSRHTSDQIRIMVGDPAESAMLGGAVALSTIGTRATSGSLPVQRKSRSKMAPWTAASVFWCALFCLLIQFSATPGALTPVKSL